MAPDAPTPIPLRPSEAERERVVSLLRAGSVDGRISLDTFSDRLVRAYDSRDRGELAGLVADVQPPGRLRRLLMRAVEGWSSLLAEVEAAWRRPRLPALALPAADGTPLTLGRSRDCDCVLADPSVSRHHAELRYEADRWLLRDLGSRNGTRVNGLRLLEETEVRPGDRISLGDARYRLAWRRAPS